MSRRSVPVLLALLSTLAVAHAEPAPRAAGPAQAALLTKLRGLIVAIDAFAPAMTAQAVRLASLGLPAVRDGVIVRGAGALHQAADDGGRVSWTLDASGDGATARRVARSTVDGKPVESVMERRLEVQRGGPSGKVTGVISTIRYAPRSTAGPSYVTTVQATQLPGVRVTARQTVREGGRAGRPVRGR